MFTCIICSIRTKFDTGESVYSKVYFNFFKVEIELLKLSYRQLKNLKPYQLDTDNDRLSYLGFKDNYKKLIKT